MKGHEEKVTEVRVRLKEQVTARETELEKCALELRSLRSELDRVKRSKLEAEEEGTSLKAMVHELQASLSEKFAVLTRRIVASEMEANSAKAELDAKKTELENGLLQMEKWRVHKQSSRFCMDGQRYAILRTMFHVALLVVILPATVFVRTHAYTYRIPTPETFERYRSKSTRESRSLALGKKKFDTSNRKRNFSRASFRTSERRWRESSKRKHTKPARCKRISKNASMTWRTKIRS